MDYSSKSVAEQQTLVSATIRNFSWYQNSNKIYVTATANEEVKRGGVIVLNDCDRFNVTCVANNIARKYFAKALYRGAYC